MKECNKKVDRCRREFSIGLPHCHQLATMQTSPRGDRGDNFDWIREQFLDLYYLNVAQSVSVRN